MRYPQDFNWLGKVLLFPILVVCCAILAPSILMAFILLKITDPLDKPFKWVCDKLVWIISSKESKPKHMYGCMATFNGDCTCKEWMGMDTPTEPTNPKED